MAKIARGTKIKAKVAKNDLPDLLDVIVYFCANCKGKHTYGSDYFVEVGPPAQCPNCGTPFVQDDQIHRYTDETDETIKMKRDDLYRQRGEAVPAVIKPDSPEAIRAAKIAELENEIKKLKGEPVPGIKLGP
jgi:hypothetical protein